MALLKEEGRRVAAMPDTVFIRRSLSMTFDPASDRKIGSGSPKHTRIPPSHRKFLWRPGENGEGEEAGLAKEGSSRGCTDLNHPEQLAKYFVIDR